MQRANARSIAYHVFLQVPSSTTPLANFDFTDVFQLEQAACTPPSWFTGDGIDFIGQTQPGYSSISDLMSMYGNTYVPWFCLPEKYLTILIDIHPRLAMLRPTSIW